MNSSIHTRVFFCLWFYTFDPSYCTLTYMIWISKRNGVLLSSYHSCENFPCINNMHAVHKKQTLSCWKQRKWLHTKLQQQQQPQKEDNWQQTGENQAPHWNHTVREEMAVEKQSSGRWQKTFTPDLCNSTWLSCDFFFFFLLSVFLTEDIVNWVTLWCYHSNIISSLHTKMWHQRIKWIFCCSGSVFLAQATLNTLIIDSSCWWLIFM